jgi:hypothetical protein
VAHGVGLALTARSCVCRHLHYQRFPVSHSAFLVDAIGLDVRLLDGRRTVHDILFVRCWRLGAAPSAVEVFALDAIEVKNVVRAKRATWSLKAWLDLSSDNSAGGI